MDLYEVLDQVVELLRQRGKVTYRALKFQFKLDDEALSVLKDELLYTHPQVIDDEGRGLSWCRDADVPRESTALPQTDHQSISQAASAIPSPEPHIPDAERRQLTVMFCDLVGSTALSGRLDPEDLREVIRAYQQASTEVIERYDGHVAQHLGDGLMVYFGWPHAHEDDPQRAIHAALGILEAMDGVNVELQQTRGIRLAVRMGIHTGPVVIGEIGAGVRQEQLALGETPNVAARVQGLAQPDTLVISRTTHQLVQGYFDCIPLGEQALRGVVEPVAVYRVLGESGAQSRLDVASTRELTPLVGRESEITLLLNRWQQVKDKQGQIVLLSGEPGIGKTRVVQTLKDQVSEEPHTRLECRSSPYFTNSALYPIMALVQSNGATSFL